jgi:two-component system chemotaxis response regulator CheY
MKKIMIADDSMAVRIEIIKVLRPHGYTVIEAVDGLDALEKARHHEDIKLFLLDYNMPHLDGLSVAKEIRKLDAFKSVPMAMLTTETSSLLKEQAKSYGVSIWIVKPINAAAFLMMAEQFTGGSKAK